jgi:deoxyadenosine/deoxycytidine kinase
MERSYIDELNHAYDEFFAKPYDHTPVLTIDTNLINIVQNPDDLKEVENRIKQALGISPFQPSLPMKS